MDFTKLKKLESGGVRPVPRREDETITAIVKVKTPGYLPKCVKVRSKMGAYLFTAEFPARDLQNLEADPDVEAVSVSHPLPLQKLPV